MSNNSALAVPSLPSYVATLNPDWEAERDQLIFDAEFLLNISNVEHQAVAVDLASKIKNWVKRVEKAREELKRPLLDASKILDNTAKKAVEPANKEIQRLESMLSAFYRQQEAERQAALREQERIEREAREAAEAIKRKEAARLAVLEAARIEAELQAQKAKTKKAREAAEAMAAQLKAQQEEEEFNQGFEATVPAPVFVAPPEVVKPKGAQTRRVVKFEVVDVEALYKAYPQCVELVPSKIAINYLLNTPGVDINNIPGIKAWSDIKTSTRS